ncbi:hypothetical protein L0664_00845 [Octadecabacter sp. G9-8]|uniref:Uncharacterized protein n=1 Tax=Octadecabacter dasysiphoniae TaxID=2909341 RepID=A0ABS9CU85_9RHOB|nr:hypothetical protein [Octadecabacter dasysiphoniae]MCF2869598.1 hypothetical protein [Octadecabacter dasysiphoniae]
MKLIMTAALIATATTAAADYKPYNYAYEATMQTLGGGQNVLAHELANCPVQGASQAQMFAMFETAGQAREDAINAVFENNPRAVGCVLEVLVRYDLITIEDLTR